MGVVSQKSVYKKGEGPIFRVTFNLKKIQVMNNTNLSFSKEQLMQIIASIKASGESYQSLFQVLLEAMMLAEREEYKLEKDDLSNGFRPRRLRGSQGTIELSVPRTRYGNFYPIPPLQYQGSTSRDGAT